MCANYTIDKTSDMDTKEPMVGSESSNEQSICDEFDIDEEFLEQK